MIAIDFLTGRSLTTPEGLSQPLKASHPDLQQGSNFKQTLEETSVFKTIPYDGADHATYWCFQQWLADLSLQGPVVAINFLKERTPQARTKLYLISTVVWIQIG
ncbi:hypothetical protein LWI29_024931 [Acer saccharum]|uniref:Uncharacterized protein n=1 Tax=Acer saccharum TaxID=4024 RepID=A0AA39W3L2_ACESA|nr:hypothetical protein LWI29_024931 [Acer saccharum]